MGDNVFYANTNRMPVYSIFNFVSLIDVLIKKMSMAHYLNEMREQGV